MFSDSAVADNQAPNRHVYEDLIRTVAHTIDAYHWLGHDEAGGIRQALEEIASTSEKVVDEFEKVQQLRGQADQLAANLEADAKERMRDADLADYAIIDDFVTNLDQLRRMRAALKRHVTSATLIMIVWMPWMNNARHVPLNWPNARLVFTA